MRALPALAANSAPSLPTALLKLHAQVAAFTPVPMPKPQHMMVGSGPIAPQNRYGPNSPFYWFDDLKQAYAYPAYTTANGAGKTVAVVAASDFLDSDVAAYFGHEGLAPPTIVRRPVDGGSPPFNINSGLSDEVSLDVQQSGGSAPGATIMVYEAPDASFTPSFVDVYTAIDEDNLADVVSTSFGLCELDFLASYNDGQDFTYLLQMFHDLFRQGNAQGITFVESSGDNGAQGGECTDPTFTNAVFGVSARIVSGVCRTTGDSRPASRRPRRQRELSHLRAGRNNIPGNNGYPSKKGYNFVVGNGTLYGSRYALDPFGPIAGNPQTPSNP